VELGEALRTTGAVREFTGEPVDDAVLGRILDAARFAPNGGNRQAWRVVVVRRPEVRRALRDAYLAGWYEYLAQGAAGLTPWGALNDRAAESDAVSTAPALAAQAAAGPGGFPEHLDEVPVLLVLLADLRRLATVDRDLDRIPLVGGASVYPFAWSILLAARDEGLGGVVTTMAVRGEPHLRTVLGLPDEVVMAGVIALGHPVHRSTRLRREPVAAFTTVDRYDGTPFAPPGGP
jgi:nitroreductase